MSSKPPSWNAIRAAAAAFASSWAGETRERAEAQTFWNEFFQIFGIERRRVAVFEEYVKKSSTGTRGSADLLWPRVILAEHKSAHKDLDEAERQALDYVGGLDQDRIPRLVVVSDFANIRIRDLESDGPSTTFPLADLPMQVDRFGILAGYNRRTFASEVEEAANIAAAKIMGELYEELARYGYADHDSSVLLVRILFLLFGDDTGMWERGLFAEWIDTRTQSDGSDLGSQLLQLFEVLDTEESRRLSGLDEILLRFPFVNGGLFAERIRFPVFDARMRHQLIRAAAFDWSRISPAVFGSLFQAVKSREARRELGEHYTTEKNIMRVIQPLFLDELRDQFEASRNSVQRLRNLRDRIGRYRFLDPACGCGNFLVIAYRELRRLELDILRRLRDLDGGGQQLGLDVTLDLRVRLDHFYGIELEEWPARIAETAMFLVDHQANLALSQEFGEAPERLPIEIAATIRVGNALREQWETLVRPTDDLVVLGNPPFHGMSRMTTAQQQDNRDVFSSLDARGLRTGRLDYVACWYAKTLPYLTGTKARAAFVSTNSLIQGEQARSMLPLLERYGFKIDFGHRTFKWTSEAPQAAVVHVVVVGFSHGGNSVKKRLFDYATITSEPVETNPKNVNWYLLDGENFSPAKRTRPLIAHLPTASKGSQPTDGGHLIVTSEQLAEVQADPIAAKYLRPFKQTSQFLYPVERWCLWLVDADPADLRASGVLRQRLRAVADERLKSDTASVVDAAKTPSLFTQIRQPNVRYLALPEVSSEFRDYVPGAFLEPDVIAGNKLIVWPDPPLWLFGYLQSSLWMAWVRTYSGRMKSDFSLAPGLVYFSFPFVEPTGNVLARIEEAARQVLAARDAHPGASLADLYAPLAMPKNLREAHTRLDSQIDALFGLRRPTEASRMRALLERYSQLTSESALPGMPSPVPTGRARRRPSAG